jgi:hypothetical protein
VHEGARNRATDLEQGGRPQRVGKQLARDFDKGAIGLLDEQHADVLRHMSREAFDGEAGAGVGGFRLADVGGAVEEAQFVRTGAVERRNAGDAAVEIEGTLRHGARQRRNLPNGKPPRRLAEQRRAHAVIP